MVGWLSLESRAKGAPCLDMPCTSSAVRAIFAAFHTLFLAMIHTAPPTMRNPCTRIDFFPPHTQVDKAVQEDLDSTLIPTFYSSQSAPATEKPHKKRATVQRPALSRLSSSSSKGSKGSARSRSDSRRLQSTVCPAWLLLWSQAQSLELTLCIK